jgi:hypothetical protein
VLTLVLVFSPVTIAADVPAATGHDTAPSTGVSDIRSEDSVTGEPPTEFQEVAIAPAYYDDLEAGQDAPGALPGNRTTVRLNLSGYVGTGAIQLKFADYWPTDGWGPSLTHTTVEADGEVIHNIDATSDEEILNYLEEDGGSSARNFGARFADGENDWIYEFAVPDHADSVNVTLEIANGFRVLARAPQNHSTYDDSPDLAPLTETHLLDVDRVAPDTLSGTITVEDGIAQFTTAAIEQASETNYSLDITAPGDARNVTVYLRTGSISATGDPQDLRMYVDGAEHPFVANASTGAISGSWVAFNVPSFASRTVRVRFAGGDTDPTTCIGGAVAGGDGDISLPEIQAAINWWAEDDPVPNTGGKTLTLPKIQSLINAWAQDQTVGC